MIGFYQHGKLFNNHNDYSGNNTWKKNDCSIQFNNKKWNKDYNNKIFIKYFVRLIFAFKFSGN
jgi:hypothetical protein